VLVLPESGWENGLVTRWRSGTVPRHARTADLPDERIVASVRLHYGLHLTTLVFLPLGQAVTAWAFRATTAAAVTCFVKLHQGRVNPAGLRMPRYLADHGVAYVVAPLPTHGLRLWGNVDGFTLTLYPFITDSTGAALELQEQHWVS